MTEDTTITEMFMRVGLLVQERDELTEANTVMAQRLSAVTELLREIAPPEVHAMPVGRWCHDVRDFLASPDAVVQARADAVRAAYEALTSSKALIEVLGYLGIFDKPVDVEGRMFRYEPNQISIDLSRALATLHEAFPELQS